MGHREPELDSRARAVFAERRPRPVVSVGAAADARLAHRRAQPAEPRDLHRRQHACRQRAVRAADSGEHDAQAAEYFEGALLIAAMRHSADMRQVHKGRRTQRRSRGTLQRRLATVAAIVSVLGALSSAAVSSQTQPPVFRSGSQLTVVDVTVMDKQGHPVEGLAAGDFSITEDGVPQSISLVAYQKLD